MRLLFAGFACVASHTALALSNRSSPYVSKAVAARDRTGTDPCAAGDKTNCGIANSGPFCKQACAWNASEGGCVSVNNYPLPSNATLEALVSSASPLNSSEWITISWYGDSITWLGLYEAQIASAFASGPGTRGLKARLINQGVDGGTVKDLGARERD